MHDTTLDIRIALRTRGKSPIVGQGALGHGCSDGRGRLSIGAGGHPDEHQEPGRIRRAGDRVTGLQPRYAPQF